LLIIGRIIKKTVKTKALKKKGSLDLHPPEDRLGENIGPYSRPRGGEDKNATTPNIINTMGRKRRTKKRPAR